MNRNIEVTITIKGFKNKKEAIAWLQEYEGGIEQYFDIDGPSMTDMDLYIPEMKGFKKYPDKTNFDLYLT